MVRLAVTETRARRIKNATAGKTMSFVHAHHNAVRTVSAVAFWYLAASSAVLAQEEAQTEEAADAESDAAPRPGPEEEPPPDAAPAVEGVSAEGAARPAPPEPTAPEPAKKSLPKPGEGLDTRLSGRLVSEVFLQRPVVRNLGRGVYAVSAERVFPFYESLSLRADEVYHRGLSVHFSGWAGLDLADVYFDDRLVGDPTYLYVQFRDHGVDARAGRQMVYTGSARGLHIDGAHAAYQTPINVGVEALGGLLVSPLRGPQWYREPIPVDADSFGAGFSDWEREGEYAYGGRLFYRKTGTVSGGVSFLQVTELDEVERQLLGADLSVTPVQWIGGSGNFTLDLFEQRIQEIDLGIDVRPLDPLGVGVDFRHADPTLYLSRMSIFSVFSTEEYDAVGGTVRTFPLDWLEAHAGYHHHIYSYTSHPENKTDTGNEIAAGISMRYGEQRDGFVRVDYRRLEERVNGMHQLGAGIIVPLPLPGLKTTADVYLDVFDERVNGEDLGFLGDLGLFYATGALEGGGSIAAGATPYDRDEVRGMVRLAYNFDHRFSQRMRP
jgi:hypothetical protein